MSSKEFIEEGPIFVTTKAVRGEPLMREFIEKIEKMTNENVLRYYMF